MTQTFQQIGESLQQRRKEMNLSIREIENATSIRAAHLQAIENGDGSKLISPIYAQGFVRQYATFLGLDGEALVRENAGVFADTGSQEFAYGIGTIEIRDNPGNNVKWIPNALWVLAFVALFVAAWYFAKLFEVI